MGSAYVAMVCSDLRRHGLLNVSTSRASLGAREVLWCLYVVHRLVRDLEQNESHEGAVVGSAHVPCWGLVLELLNVQIFGDYSGVVFAHCGRKLVNCILTDVGNFILYTLELGTLALFGLGIAFAPAECSLSSTLLGFELLELLKRELEYCTVTGYSWVLESYVDTDDGLRCFFGDVWTVEGDCHVPMGSYVLNCVACDFALEAWLLSQLNVANIGKTKAVIDYSCLIVRYLERDPLGPLVLLRVLCIVSEEALERST